MGRDRVWEIADPGVPRDPARYLGALTELPRVETRQPGDWCDLIVRDDLGEMHYSLVVVEAVAARSIFVDYTGAAHGAEHGEDVLR